VQELKPAEIISAAAPFIRLAIKPCAVPFVWRDFDGKIMVTDKVDVKRALAPPHFDAPFLLFVEGWLQGSVE
jgi:hypothetical protein